MFGGGGAGLWFIEGLGRGRDRVVLAAGTAFLMVPTIDQLQIYDHASYVQSQAFSPSWPYLTISLMSSSGKAAYPIVSSPFFTSSSLGLVSLYFSYFSINSVKYEAFLAERMNLCFSNSFAVGRWESAIWYCKAQTSLQLGDHVGSTVERNLGMGGRTSYRQAEEVDSWE